MGRPKRKSTSPYASNRSASGPPKKKTGSQASTSAIQHQDNPDLNHHTTPSSGHQTETHEQQGSTSSQQDVTVLYWRDPPVSDPPETLPSPSPARTVPTISNTETSGINQHTIPIASIHSALGSHVSQSNKNKIINGEYIDLSQLLENTIKHEKQENQIVMVDGVLTTKAKSKNSLNTIEVWTDAFIVYISIYSAVHASKFQALLKYMHDVRLGASRIRGLGWKEYDEQFRLKMSANPTKSWENIDQELWLLYMVSANTMPEIKHNSQVGLKSSINKCYNFNYKGTCDRTPCNYKHVCFKCSGNHPFFACTVSVGHSQLHQPFRHGAPNRFQNPGFQGSFRPRIPTQNTRAQGGPRYMGHRQISHQD